MDYSQYAEFCVVQQHEVNVRSTQGWRLVEVVPSTSTVQSSVKKVLPPDQYSGYSPRDVWEDVVNVIATPLFVMGRVRDQILEEARAACSAAEEVAHERCKEAAAEKHAAGGLQVKLTTAEMQVGQLNAKLAIEVSRSVQREEVVRKLETALAAVRRAIGEKQMNEILAEAK